VYADNTAKESSQIKKQIKIKIVVINADSIRLVEVDQVFTPSFLKVVFSAIPWFIIF